MIAEFSIIPIGKGESLSPYVAEIYKVTEESGLPYERHQMGTNVEGEKKEIVNLFEKCLEKGMELSDRFLLSVTIDYRKGAKDILKTGYKVKSAEDKLKTLKEVR